ncbi:hypothetical protein N7450_006159 [Penicillium hetheringtonii]|uniref:SnoaL-like domain-containing protein n=1 Tax=Penicillium hetheringtonii TaxID=911720 RepID=A0AAD6GT07_9EURO|nr:hypothetical protein N7450_006159 [Penicillium hetheringtonii]
MIIHHYLIVGLAILASASSRSTQKILTGPECDASGLIDPDSHDSCSGNGLVIDPISGHSRPLVGHHAIAGQYHDLLHFYVNALRRVSMLFMDHADKFEIHPMAIHGGCNSEWSVGEINSKGVMNSGEAFDIVNVWVTQWDHNQQMAEIRTYIDSTRIPEALEKNEIWWNGTTDRDNL